MNVHELKCWPEIFTPIEDGSKPFDIRRTDRPFAVGDLIRFREWEPRTETYTGRECARRITFVFSGAGSVGTIEPLKGLAQGFAVLGLKKHYQACAALAKTDPPQDCGWPFCGCDPEAEKVLSAIDESNAVIVSRNTLTRVLHDSPPAQADVDELRKAVE